MVSIYHFKHGFSDCYIDEDYATASTSNKLKTKVNSTAEKRNIFTLYFITSYYWCIISVLYNHACNHIFK